MPKRSLAGELELLRECRAAERVIKLHWLRARRGELGAVLECIDRELAGLERELGGNVERGIFRGSGGAGDAGAEARLPGRLQVVGG